MTLSLIFIFFIVLSRTSQHFLEHDTFWVLLIYFFFLWFPGPKEIPTSCVYFLLSSKQLDEFLCSNNLVAIWKTNAHKLKVKSSIFIIIFKYRNYLLMECVCLLSFVHLPKSWNEAGYQHPHFLYTFLFVRYLLFYFSNQRTSNFASVISLVIMQHDQCWKWEWSPLVAHGLANRCCWVSLEIFKHPMTPLWVFSSVQTALVYCLETACLSYFGIFSEHKNLSSFTKIPNRNLFGIILNLYSKSDIIEIFVIFYLSLHANEIFLFLFWSFHNGFASF